LEDFRIEDCNDRAANLLGLLRIHLVGKLAKGAVPENSRAELLAICRKVLSTGIYEDELRVPTHGWLRATWVYRRAVHSGTGIALTLRDISDVKTHEQALADLANNDPLTQLPNRRWLMNFLPAAIRRAERGRGKLALMFIDLDNFKGVNDTIGHPAGDEVLVQAAARIRDTVRASDYVVRLGGDEFTVVLDNADSNEAVARI
ncbi:MAG: diguanylate cyclase, partial [Burkholderiaceae bacterium]